MNRPPRRLPAPTYEPIERASDDEGYDWAAVHARDETMGEMSDYQDVRDEPDYEAWEEYLIPGLADDVLRNKFTGPGEPHGVSEPDRLQRLEEAFTATRMIELQEKPLKGDFDYDHMRAIHEYIFQDVYTWAGRQRLVDLNKAGHQYAPLSGIEQLWELQHELLVQDDHLKGVTDPEVFASQVAQTWGMVNFAHAFREGNTRAQVMFFHQLADEAGWDLDVGRLSPHHPQSVRQEFVDARFHHQSSVGHDHLPLAQVLSKVLSKRGPQIEHAHQPPPQPSSQRECVEDRLRRFPELRDTGPPTDQPRRSAPELDL